MILNILAHRNATQRALIEQEYETKFSDDLRKRLQSELHGHLKVKSDPTTKTIYKKKIKNVYE